MTDFKDPNLIINYDQAIDAVVINVGNDLGRRSRVQNIPTIAMYPSQGRSWQVDTSYIDYLLNQYPEYNLADDAAAHYINFQIKQKNLNNESIKILEEIETTNVLNKPFGNLNLYDFQKEGIKFLIKNKRSILSDDLGLGKTIQALVAMSFTKDPVYVVAPVSLHHNWETEARRLRVKITLLSSTNLFGLDLKAPYNLIVDEAHYFQNINSMRTFQLIKIAGPAGFIFLITGTPIKNGVATNLFPLLVAVRHPISYNRARFGFDYPKKTGKSYNLTTLYNKTKDIILRRTKDECLTLPPFTRVMREVNTEARKSFNIRFENKFFELRNKYCLSPFIHTPADALKTLIAVRQAGSIAKIDETLNLVEEVFEQGNKILVFVAFKDTAEELQRVLVAENKTIRTGVLSSDYSVGERNETIDEFNEGKIDCLIATFGTGGVGLNLTNASYVLLHDRPWTPGEAEQAEGRAHRIGQTKPVTSIWLQMLSVDKYIDNILMSKQRNINEVLTGKPSELIFDGYDIRGNAKEILDEIFK